MKKVAIDINTYYPDWICDDCGSKHGKRPEGNPYGATYHSDWCGVCFEWKSVTEPRDWGHLKPSFKKQMAKYIDGLKTRWLGEAAK
jgi:hypothetical protein